MQEAKKFNPATADHGTATELNLLSKKKIRIAFRYLYATTIQHLNRIKSSKLLLISFAIVLLPLLYQKCFALKNLQARTDCWKQTCNGTFSSVVPSISLIRIWRCSGVPKVRHFSTTLEANFCWLIFTIWPASCVIIVERSSGFPCCRTCCKTRNRII